MSGVFDPNEPGIHATDDKAIADAHGLTEWNEEQQQWVAPAETAEEQRDADDARARELRDETPAEHDALAEGYAPEAQPAATESDNAERVDDAALAENANAADDQQQQ